MADQLKSERVTIMMAPADLKELDDFRFEYRIASRGEAMRRLMQVGLQVAKQQPKKGMK